MAECMTPQERGQRMIRESGYASGGAIRSDEAEDKALVRKGVRQHETQEHGGKHADLKLKGGGYIKGDKPGFHPGRKSRAGGGAVDGAQALAKGGKVKGKPGIGKVNIVIAHPGGAGGAGAGPVPAPMPPPRPMMPPPRPPMPPPGGGGPPPPGIGGPPGMGPPGGPPPGMGGPPPGMMRPPPGGPPQMAAGGGRVRDAFGRFVGGAV